MKATVLTYLSKICFRSSSFGMTFHRLSNTSLGSVLSHVENCVTCNTCLVRPICVHIHTTFTTFLGRTIRFLSEATRRMTLVQPIRHGLMHNWKSISWMSRSRALNSSTRCSQSSGFSSFKAAAAAAGGGGALGVDFCQNKTAKGQWQPPPQTRPGQA